MRMLVAGGGSGGHLFPGVAVAECWLALGDGRAVAFAGHPDGMEARLVPELGHRFFPVRSGAVLGRGLVARIRSMIQLAGGLVDAGAVLRSFDPHVVLGVGGYASVPVVLRAALGRRPTAIQEQNADPGLANRFLGRLARRAFVSHPRTEAAFARGRARYTGNPVRPALVEELERTRRDRTADARRSILVFGGSQGAATLNRVVPEAVARVAELLGSERLRVVHQTGPPHASWGSRDDVLGRYGAMGVEAEVAEFFHDMGRRYGAADLAVTRAGAGTLAELAVAGVPAILVPFPHAGAHQAANARSFATSGAALCIEETELTEEGLAGEIHRILADDGARAGMAERCRALARPDAAEAIARECDPPREG